ncbi:glycine-rich protein DOT1 [Drosophila grimshawi]|uniref:GH16011 n=1 Tax=Drosophila grimshawi TaxID=7222 RepID=B4J2F8_DROGR|nr:glycine-rich protein DOT1 [Drosophila grimshawi]EDV96017.1 GH16011 [Drosophila grimshawi]
MRKDCLIALLALVCQLALATADRSDDDHWVWRTYSRRQRAFKDDDIDRIASTSSRKTHEQQLRREPTTRRPLPGEPENDEIEDYVDVQPTVSPNVGTRQYSPYPSGNPYGGFGGAQPNGGQFAGGFGGSPGVLVGPGGPTGVIGRQPLYPNVYQNGFGGGQNGLGFGQGQGHGLGGYPGSFGSFGGATFPGVGGGYPGAQQGQFAGAGSQYPFGGFAGAGTNYNSNQFATPGGQYAGVGQYPVAQYGGPQYTEGYGLASFGQGQPGVPVSGFGGNYGAGGNFGSNLFGFDEKSPAVAEGKSAKSVAIAPATVNDKLSMDKKA